jgi:hypothetical protein
MITLINRPKWWLKILRVKGQTSYQSHKNRTEYHLGISKVLPNERHRMSHGWFIEVATGRPEEDDITRFEDEYGR